jgi:DNA/RNA-binding domain of Phe-tRNA-synthetase-like protein
MMITISDEIKNKIPNFKIGVIAYENITVSNTPQMLKGRLQLFQESLMFDMEKKELSDFQGLKEWRKLFKQIGTDPSKYRPSVEALYRRVKKGNVLMTDNSAIDINNFFSMQYEIPLGIYNIDALEKPISITVGNSDCHYDALNGRVVTMEDKFVTADAIGPFGSPIVDSKRTMITTETTRALHIIYFTASISSDEAKEMLRAIEKMFIQVHGGEVKQSQVITA